MPPCDIGCFRVGQLQHVRSLLKIGRTQHVIVRRHDPQQPWMAALTFAGRPDDGAAAEAQRVNARGSSRQAATGRRDVRWAATVAVRRRRRRSNAEAGKQERRKRREERRAFGGGRRARKRAERQAPRRRRAREVRVAVRAETVTFSATPRKKKAREARLLFRRLRAAAFSLDYLQFST